MATDRYLILDDDENFRRSLVRSLQRRGDYAVGVESISEAKEMLRVERFGRAVIDLRIRLESGLDAVRELRAVQPDIAVVVLTGYGSIATAQEAIRRGAVSYLTKPIDTERIIRSFSPSDEPIPEAHVPSLDQVEWEHLNRVLEDCQGNISLTARTLGLHRRSLQRKLQKSPPSQKGR